MKKYLIFIALCLSLSFNSCAIKQNDMPIQDTRVHFTSPALLTWLKLTNLIAIKQEDGIIKMQADFINSSALDHMFAYQINWKDENGFMIKSLASRAVLLKAKSHMPLSIQALSPNSKAADFELIMQDLDDYTQNKKRK